MLQSHRDPDPREDWSLGHLLQSLATRRPPQQVRNNKGLDQDNSSAGGKNGHLGYILKEGS
jgi:hypothetical protein